MISKLKNDGIKNINELANGLRKYCSKDDDFLYTIIFSQNIDENYFQMQKKIPQNPSINIEIKNKQIVKENKDVNYLRKGLFKEIADPKIYSSNGIFWQNAYFPFKIKKHTYVIKFLHSASKIEVSLNEYKTELNTINKYIIIISIITIIAIFILTFLFTHNFSLLIKNLSNYFKKASEGDLDISLNPISDDKLNEFASSVNSIINKLKEKERVIHDLENRDPFNDIFKIGVSLIKEEKIDDSISLFKTLTILNPNGFASYFNLGVAYAKNKNYKNSLIMFEKAKNANPEHELTKKYLQKVEQLQKNNGISR